MADLTFVYNSENYVHVLALVYFRNNSERVKRQRTQETFYSFWLFLLQQRLCFRLENPSEKDVCLRTSSRTLKSL